MILTHKQEVLEHIGETSSSVYDKAYQQGRADVVKCIKSHLCLNDEDFDKPIISPKYLNDYLDMMIMDGFEKIIYIGQNS